MAIESDQLVFDYLSRVGDLAHRQQLSSKTRMRLVTELRAEIDRRRAKAVGGKAPGDSPAGVRRILERLGTPAEVVARAGGGADRADDGAASDGYGAAGVPDPPVDVRPAPRREPAPKPMPEPEPEPPSRPRSRWWSPPFVPGQWADERGSDEQPDAAPRRRFVPRSRLTKDAAPPEPPPVVSTPPHLAGEDEVGSSGSEPDWWRIDNGPSGFSDSVPGFVGGVEIPEILRPPRAEPEGSAPSPGNPRAPLTKKPAGKAKPDAAHEPDEDEAFDEGEADEAGGRRRLFLRRVRAARGAPSLSNPLLLLAAVSLVTGAVTGSWIALGLGWAIAYSSRRLTQNEAKFAALGLPGLVAAAGVVWLWGRFDGQWGEAVPKDGTAAALSQTWPWVARGAAVASALFLVWRSQRQRPE